MATLSTRDGRRIIQWPDPTRANRRVTLSLGRMAEKTARAVLAHVEHLLAAKAVGQAPPLDSAKWVGGLEGKLRRKMERVGLVEPSGEKPVTKLLPFLDGYIARRTDLKRNTVLNLGQAKRSLVAFFKADRDIGTISRAEARDWRRALAAQYSEATVATFVTKAQQFFGDAVERRLMAENPFSVLTAGSYVNDTRLVYVPAADVLKVIDATPDLEWKLVFALARFVGCRVPSEIREMKWTDLTIGTGEKAERLLIHSPKTEHHRGKESRIVPVNRELLDLWLVASFDPEKGDLVYVLPRLRQIHNLATMAAKLVERAGLTPWPRILQNLRASCETDWAAAFPLHVACAWIGNTQAVAARHYLSVTEQHYAEASRKSAAPGAADHAGTERPETAVAGAKAAIPPRKSTERLPPHGIDNSPESRELMQATHEALQKALHFHQRTADRLSAPSPTFPCAGESTEGRHAHD